ncbi:hypothetical protein [Salidesulfovibrio onnuriiensis]|uniref:hypothetical protein n=1 Tax=Salidesulfovibrio onnuriiensis TaxID=2583823 RepID=UPI0011C70EF7|nr:hypothetical protein [Salidesulfovibrio onnuriiensis]
MPTQLLNYDRDDYNLLEMLNDLLSRKTERTQFRPLLEPSLKPHGIKELAAAPELRIAYAIMHLLESLKSDQASDRIAALMTLRDETLTTARGGMRNNRARVLVQIGKELVRAKGNSRRQLQLAHDFRRAAVGKNGYLRRQLRKYHLLEMPEEWNQISFDNRVHDANSKGRKSATHLIMDAWLKGIRFLTVVYYESMAPEVAKELFASAAILGIKVQAGIEYVARFRGRFVKFVWNPSGLRDDIDIDGFFRKEGVRELLSQGREVQEYKARYVEAVARKFNEVHRFSIEQEFGVALPPVDYPDMVASMETGQPTIYHLGNHIHETALPLFQEHTAQLKQKYERADYDTKAAMALQVESLNSLDADTIVARYLMPEANPDLPDPERPVDGETVPELLTLGPAELTARLRDAGHTSQLTLILADLALEDAIELLHQCRGRITHFEMFNIKSLTDAQIRQRQPFGLLQKAINDHNAVSLKRMILACIRRLRAGDSEEGRDMIHRLQAVLADFNSLLEDYKRVPLKTSIGSGSTGRSMRSHGMGFAVLETLPAKARREVRSRQSGMCIPVHGTATEVMEYTFPEEKFGLWGSIRYGLGRVPGLRRLVGKKRRRWRVTGYQAQTRGCGNVVLLGGRHQEENGLSLYDERRKRSHGPRLERMNSSFKNVLKILLGFIPAFLTFFLTKDWWLLAYFGGIIWFAVTGLRNVLQSVLGGGGFRRSPYLRWNDYIDWERISDSLLYTGFSVPLLDWACKTMLLDKTLGITTATDPLLLYTIMAVTNGVYISTHNLVRGLPRTAALGNFFRSILSIPVAFLFNMGIGGVLEGMGVVGIAAILQLWAAVISKLASDCVAGIIEGLADREYNISMRHWDYSEKFKQVFDVFAQMEILFPTRDMIKVLNAPDKFVRLAGGEDSRLVREVVANALDMLYIMMYKPRAREALRQQLAEMTGDEVEVFLTSQQILARERDVAQLLVDGLVGRNFAQALSFYLLRYPGYLREVDRMTAPHRVCEDLLGQGVG